MGKKKADDSAPDTGKRERVKIAVREGGTRVFESQEEHDAFQEEQRRNAEGDGPSSEQS